MTTDELKESIRSAMFEQGITQGTLAQRVGCTRISLNRFLNGKQDLCCTYTLRLIEAVGGRITFKELFRGQGRA